MLARLEVGRHQLDVAQAMGVSLTTLKKWLIAALCAVAKRYNPVE